MSELQHLYPYTKHDVRLRQSTRRMRQKIALMLSLLQCHMELSVFFFLNAFSIVELSIIAVELTTTDLALNNINKVKGATIQRNFRWAIFECQ